MMRTCECPRENLKILELPASYAGICIRTDLRLLTCSVTVRPARAYTLARATLLRCFVKQSNAVDEIRPALYEAEESQIKKYA